MSAEDGDCTMNLAEVVNAPLIAAQKEIEEPLSDRVKEIGMEVRAEDADQQLTKGSPQRQSPNQLPLLIDEKDFTEKKPSIFKERPSTNTIVNIFANAQSVNLFDKNPITFDNIFSKTQIPPTQNENDSSQSVHLSEQELKQPSQFIMKYDYSSHFIQLTSFRVVKFKAGSGGIKEQVIVSLERKNEVEGKMLYFIVRNQMTRVVIYQAMLFAGIKVENFMGRNQNLKFTIVKVPMVKREGSKNQKDKLEIQQPEKNELQCQTVQVQMEKQQVQQQKIEVKEDIKVGKEEGKDEVKTVSREAGEAEMVVIEREQVRLQFEKEDQARQFKLAIQTFFSTE